jgi:peptidoglycan/LPS O-acetylase OafA/YrhL
MKRIPELDALRGLASIVIVAYHLWFIQYPIAGTAVDLFFVMSGYLITTIILGQSTEPNFLKKFYIRRSLRIWPIYYLGLFATVGLLAMLALPITSRGLIYALTYTQHIQDYFFQPTIEFSEAFRHTWTLAIEEQFYIIWPLVIVVWGRKAIVPLACTFIVGALVGRSLGFSQWILLTRGDGLAMGGLLALLLEPTKAHDARFDPKKVLAFAALFAIGLRVLTLSRFGLNENLAQRMKTVSINLGYFALIGFVVLNAGSRSLALLRDRRLVYLGQLSYGLYLYHHIIFYFVDHFSPASRVVADALKLSLSLGLAAFSWAYIEKPILRLKHRFDYHDAKTSQKMLSLPHNSPAPITG